MTIGVEIEGASEDEEPTDSSSLTGAVVTDTDWTAETILSQLRRGNIQLNPSFQRRDAWDRRRKSAFIESLVLGLPIPQIVLAEDKSRRGAFIVLDGKQRLLSLRKFAAKSSFGENDLDSRDAGFSLLGLQSRRDLNGVTMLDFESSDQWADDLNAFLNQTIRTVVVRNWPNEDFLNLVFLRLNTGSVSLSPQELRQALHPGPFADYLDKFSAESVAVKKMLRNSEPDFRMRDIEVVLRYFAMRTSLERYQGNMKHFLDSTLLEYNESWGDGTAPPRAIETLSSNLESAIEVTFEIFGHDAFFRWNTLKRQFEGRFNRAVFDIMSVYFSDSAIAEASIRQSMLVVECFKDLCGDPEFENAIQTTTKSVTATTIRYMKWAEALSGVIGEQVIAPKVGV